MKATIYSIKEAAPNRIAIVARPRGGDWLGDELRALSLEGIDVLVSMLTEEETRDLGLHQESQECGAVAIKFVNLPVPDRSVPLGRQANSGQLIFTFSVALLQLPRITSAAAAPLRARCRSTVLVSAN